MHKRFKWNYISGEQAGRTNFVILNPDQMMKTTPEPEPPFRTTPAGESLTLDVTFNAHQAGTYGESSVKSGFESGTLWSRSRDLATRTPLPSLRARNVAE
ncbi:hypothetical protein AVEN_212329-1 [Araneus ventricosus]|uniref:Uncharacterized protein n=1 Tax=Araneus ventricosus TaxID=182803 RepID=A0A4Y2EZC3_ARAVE|nr:hypothetical protein AVEN_212329-1 [Araneus ventricosus]